MRCTARLLYPAMYHDDVIHWWVEWPVILCGTKFQQRKKYVLMWRLLSAEHGGVYTARCCMITLHSNYAGPIHACTTYHYANSISYTLRKPARPTKHKTDDCSCQFLLNNRCIAHWKLAAQSRVAAYIKSMQVSSATGWRWTTAKYQG